MVRPAPPVAVANVIVPVYPPRLRTVNSRPIGLDAPLAMYND
jgi:hypothetical protein